MGIIEYHLPIEVVQIKFSTPDSNLINPTTLSIGRNEDFTEINRAYIKYDTSRIPSEAIIKSAILSMPVLTTQNDDGVNDAHMIGYIVTSTISSIDYIVWNNLPKINFGKVIFSADIHRNSVVDIDLKDVIKSYVNKTLSNNGLLFINNESQHNQATFDSNLAYRSGMTLKVRYYDPNEKFFEKNIDVSVNGNTYYSEAILGASLDNVSVFVKNVGNNHIKAVLEVSANNIDFIEESSIEEILLNETKILIPYYNGKYIRVKLITEGNSIKSTVNLQGQLI